MNQSPNTTILTLEYQILNPRPHNDLENQLDRLGSEVRSLMEEGGYTYLRSRRGRSTWEVHNTELLGPIHLIRDLNRSLPTGNSVTIKLF